MSASRMPDRVSAPTGRRGRPTAELLAVALALAMWGARAGWAGVELEFLLWNLFLAAIPWLAARAVASARAGASVAASGAVWLLFLPNAPYLVTDLVHLRARPGVPHWFDVLLFTTFGLAGCALAWSSLAAVHARLARALGRARSAAIVAGVLFLTGFGVYLGRFHRWNSWDVIARPGALLEDAAGALATPRALVFSALFGAFVGVGYLFVAPRGGWERAGRGEPAEP